MDSVWACECTKCVSYIICDPFFCYHVILYPFLKSPSDYTVVYSVVKHGKKDVWKNELLLLHTASEAVWKRKIINEDEQELTVHATDSASIT